METIADFKKISKYLKLDIPIINNYTSISGAIFNPTIPDYFLSSFFFGFIYEIIKNQAIYQLKNFITLYENSFLPYFDKYDKYENGFKKSLPEESLRFLKKLVVFVTKNKQNEAIEKMETLKEKKKEMAYIVRVVLFNFIRKMKKQITDDEDLKNDLIKREKQILKNEEIPLEIDYFFFLSAAFQLNIQIFSEEKPKEKPQRFYYNKKDKETLALAFLIDKRKRLKILTKEDMEYQEDKKQIKAAENRELLLQKDLALQKQKYIELQLKFNKLSKTYKNSVQVNTLLFESLEDLVTNIENLKKYPEKSQNFKFSNKAVLTSKLKSMLKTEVELRILHKNEENDEANPIEDIKDGLKLISSRLQKIFKFIDEEKSAFDEESEKNSDNNTNFPDRDNEDLQLENLRNSSTIDMIKKIRENKIRAEERIVIKPKVKSISKIESDFEESEERKSGDADNKDKSGLFDAMIPDKEINKPVFECPICCETMTMDEVFIFDCGHKFCNECVRTILLRKYESGQWGFKIQCFAGECSYTMNCFYAMPTLINLMGKDRVEKMSDKAALEFTTNQCAQCKEAFILAEDNEITNYCCDKCKAWTCLKCGELKHEEKICKKKWEEMKIALNNERLRCCPVCMEIYLKDEHCEHVKCHKCKTEFCYNCSAPRDPIMTHGSHYHRRGCKYFFKLMDPKNKTEILEEGDKIDPKCKECQKNKKVCERPKLNLKDYYQKLGLDLENEENPADIE